MTPQERLAALRMLRPAMDGPIKPNGCDPYTITLHRYPASAIWDEIRVLSQDLWLDGLGGVWLVFKTPSKNQAKRLRTKVRKWLDSEIAKLEQPPAEPMPEPFTQEGRDEILQSSQQMPIWDSDEFFGKDLSAGFRAAVERRAAELKAKDEEIARLTKLNDKCVEWMRANDLHKLWNDLYTQEVAPLKKQIKMMAAPAALIDRLDKLEAENDRLKEEPRRLNALLQKKIHEIESLDNRYEQQLRAFRGMCETAEKWKDAHDGLQLENTILKGRLAWANKEVQSCRGKRAADQPAPTARTAADVQVGDPAWFFYDNIGYSGVIFSIGKGVTIQSHSRAYFSKGIDSYGIDWGVIGRDTK